MRTWLLLLLRATRAAPPVYLGKYLYGDDKKVADEISAAKSDVKACQTCNEKGNQGRCARFQPVVPATTTFTPRHGHASVVFPYRQDADSPAMLAIFVVGGRTDQYEKWNFQRTSRLADVWIYTLQNNDWQQLRQLQGDFVRRTSSAFLMEDVRQPGDIAPFWERFGHSLDVVVAKVRLDKRQYRTKDRYNNTVVMADEVRALSDAVDEGKECTLDSEGGGQCCVCLQDLYSCEQDPNHPNAQCQKAQAEGIGWQQIRDEYLDYGLDLDQSCFSTAKTWTGNEPTDSDLTFYKYTDPPTDQSYYDGVEILTGAYKFRQWDDVLQVAGGNLVFTPQRVQVPCIVAEDGGDVDAMILVGGFTPKPDRDVWASRDGVSWWFVGEAPWPTRGYHSSAMFKDRLFIMGGSPLINDVWAGSFEWTGYERMGDRRDIFWLGELDQNVVREKWEMSWELIAPATGLFDYPDSWDSVKDSRRWTPRAGAAVTVQFARKGGWGFTFKTQHTPPAFCTCYRDEAQDVMVCPETCKASDLMRNPTQNKRSKAAGYRPQKVFKGPNQTQEALFLCGGLAGWPERHPLFDGQKARNDVWTSLDGANWTRVIEFAPWAARAWHSLVAWSEPSDVYSDVAFNARIEDKKYQHDGRLAPRMWLAGGGYVGKQGIAVTKMVDAYYDVWWSRDGRDWAQVGMFEGSEGYVCSSLEIYMIQEANEDFFLGKYSHTMVPFFYMHQVPVCGKPSRGIDVNNPGLLSRAFCLAGNTGDKENRRPTGNKYEDAYVPTLYFIGGDPGYLEGEDLGPQLTMFRSEANILCELDGIMCPSRTGDAAVYSTVEDGPTGWPDKDRSGSRFGVPRRRQTCNFELARGIKFADEVPECAPDGGDGDDIGGFCPSPLFGRDAMSDSFFEAENGTAFLEDPHSLGASVDDSAAHTLSKNADRRIYHMTVYNGTNVSSVAHRDSLVGRFRATIPNRVTFKQEPLVRDWIVRLTGCWCHSADYEGEFCEFLVMREAGCLLRPSLVLLFVVAALT